MHRLWPVIAALGLLHSNAAAIQTHQYHASMCQEAGSGETGSINRSEYRITNSGTSGGRYVLCPLTVEEGENNKAPSAVDVWLNVNDSDPNGSVSCYLYQRDKWGSLVTYDYEATSWSGTPGNTMLNFHINPSVVYDYAVLLRCYLNQNDGGGYLKIYNFKAFY